MSATCHVGVYATLTEPSGRATITTLLRFFEVIFGAVVSAQRSALNVEGFMMQSIGPTTTGSRTVRLRKALDALGLCDLPPWIGLDWTIGLLVSVTTMIGDLFKLRQAADESGP